MTDQEQTGDVQPVGTPEDTTEEPTATSTTLAEVPAGAAVISPATAPALELDAHDLSILDVRPTPGPPRPYQFPPFTRSRLSNGVSLIECHVPGRPLITAQWLLDGGGTTEPLDQAGVTVLMARALSEGTEQRSAIELIEASERLGADLHAEASWEHLSAGVEVPSWRLEPALILLAEMLLQPSFPDHEIDRLREERLNDLLQVRAEPRRRAERVFPEAIYDPAAAYRRPLAGIEGSVAGLGRAQVAARHAALLDPSAATLIVAGDLTGLSVAELADRSLDAWSSGSGADATSDDPSAAADLARTGGRRVIFVDRPGSPQAEIRIGHVGVARRIEDYHALSVMNAILGGLFNSRLQRLLREERGYTYSIHSMFEMRRNRGPFAVRTAVETAVTIPAIEAILSELDRLREGPIEQHELDEARDYLIGVFPLRFESSAQVAAAIAGLVAYGLPDDELDRYRPAVASVTGEAVLEAARTHLRPDEAAIVVVGDAAAIESGLREAHLGPVEVVRDAPGDAAG